MKQTYKLTRAGGYIFQVRFSFPALTIVAADPNGITTSELFIQLHRQPRPIDDDKLKSSRYYVRIEFLDIGQPWRGMAVEKEPSWTNYNKKPVRIWADDLTDFERHYSFTPRSADFDRADLHGARIDGNRWQLARTLHG